MTPAQEVELLRLADRVEKFGLKRTATEMRALLEPVDDERPCPIQDRSGQLRAIPWGLAEILYPAYGCGQTLERLAERGGFGRGELGMLAADCYSGSADRSWPRLARMPLLDLYEAAKRGNRK